MHCLKYYISYKKFIGLLKIRINLYFIRAKTYIKCKDQINKQIILFSKNDYNFIV